MAIRDSLSLYYVVVAILLGVVLVLAFFGDKGLVRRYQMVRERDIIVARIGKLKQENIYLRQQLLSLKNDRHYIEDLARRELGYVREGEIVYRFRD